MKQDIHVTLYPDGLGKSSINMKIIFTSKLDLNLRKRLVECYMWSIALCGAGILTVLKVDQKYLERTEMW
jgi:hypothetical protein